MKMGLGPDPVSGVARPSRVRFLVLGAACSLAIVTYILRVGFASVSSEIRADLGLRQDHLGYLLAAFMVAYGLFEVPWGLVGDRHGVRGSLSLVALAGSLTTGAVALVAYLPRGLSWSFGSLLVLRFLFGAAQAGTFPLISRMMAEWIPSTERGGAQGAIWMSSRLGGALAPWLLIPLLQSLTNWRTPLVLAASLGGLWTIVFWPWFRDRPESMPGVNAAEMALIAEGRKPPQAGHQGTPWRRMLAMPSVWALCLMYGGLGYSGNFFLSLLSDYLKTHRGLGQGTITWMTSLPYAVGVLACLAGGTLSDLIIRRTGDRSRGRRLVGMTGMVLAAVAILATIATRDVPTLAVLLGLTFLGNDLAMGPAWAAVADQGEEHAGTLGGLMNMTASMTGALMMIVTGRLLEIGYSRLPFVLFSIAYLLGALAWLGVNVSQSLVKDRWGPLEEVA